MTSFLANTRYVGWTLAGLLVFATLTTWITISGPLVGNISVIGVKHDDGRIALGLAVALAVVATFATRVWLGVCGVIATGFYGYAYIHVSTYDVGEKANSTIGHAFAKNVNINPGLGIYLGLLAGVALLLWGLVPLISPRREAAA
jgi:hypothetical protein